MTDYVLHYAPDNASLIVRWMLEELDQPYRAQLVDRRQKAQHTAAYRRVNPAGLIPTLETPTGPLFETAAIVLWLSEQHGSMAPAPTDPARGDFLKHLFFISNTLHAMLRQSFYPGKYVGTDPDAQAALRQRIQTRHSHDMTLPGALDLLETHLIQTGRLYFEGDAPGVLDLYVAVILRWCGLYPADAHDWFDLAEWPALARMAGTAEQRPAALRIAAAEGLGPTPFTKPQIATPPEGSAL